MIYDGIYERSNRRVEEEIEADKKLRGEQNSPNQKTLMMEHLEEMEAKLEEEAVH